MATERKSTSTDESNSKTQMEPEHSFVSTKAFKFAVWGPIIIATSLTLLISVKSNLTPSLTVEGLAYFYDNFKLPLGIITLSIPLGALVATHHRSLQTSEQLRKQEKQNKFANHIEHKKQFREFIKEINPLRDFSPWNSWQLYESLFPTAKSGNFSASPEVIDLIDMTIGFQENLKIFLNEKYENGSEQASIDNVNILKFALNTEYYKLSGIELGTSFSSIQQYIQVYDLSNEVHAVANGIISCSNFQTVSIDAEKSRKINENHQQLTKICNEIKLIKDLASSIESAVQDIEQQQGKSSTNAKVEVMKLIGTVSAALEGKGESEKRRIMDRIKNVELSPQARETLKKLASLQNDSKRTDDQ